MPNEDELHYTVLRNIADSTFSIATMLLLASATPDALHKIGNGEGALVATVLALWSAYLLRRYLCTLLLQALSYHS